MEARNITIVSTANQNKYVVNTNATTLGELKAALDAQGISHAGMTFYEGLSHTELLTDASVLPHDVPYKGTTTNELVFMLTTPNKKIRSGAALPETRQALYEAIVELGLKDQCMSVYGKNFTQCKNSELMALIEDANVAADGGEHCVTRLEKALDLLIETLWESDYLSTKEVNDIRAVLNSNGTSAPKSPYSDDEVESMFEFLN